MLLTLIGINLAFFSTMKWWNSRTQKTAELNRWAPFRQNPPLDRLLRRYAGTVEDPKKRWAANRFKTFVRNFVNSESFSIAVDGLANQESAFWNAGLNFKKLIHRKPKDGDLQPLAETACTIQ